MSPSAESPLIVWLRRDLRLADNPALAAAAATGAPVVPLFVLDEAGEGRPPGGAARWWLDKSLAALADSLSTPGSRLVLRRGPAAEVLRGLIGETGAGAVYWNRLYDPAAVERDRALKAELREAGLEARSFNAALLVEPWDLRTGAGGGFKVFTPFLRALRGSVGPIEPGPAPTSLRAPRRWPASERLADWRLHPTKPDWSAGFADWTPGEAGAQARLDVFLDDGLGAYAEARDAPAAGATSRLSPHLHFGEIGPRQVWRAAADCAVLEPGLGAAAEKFLSELGWREFNHHLLFHNPDLPAANVRAAFDRFPWRGDDAGFSAWSRGRTGYPIVDAGMRELWTTGFMHNRVRMIVASFLIKHLLVDWRRGEAWFWDTLVDADLANNAANWQWVAGSGADAAPYFRIFNPIAQGERFDPKGAYVRRWVPELAALPDKLIHQPWTAPSPPAGYPPPIVDHAAARERALAAFGTIRSAAAG
jgi:deoxyribodipyrimidine photo-lyase